MAWKEYRELFTARGDFRGGLPLLIFTGLLGFYFPGLGGHAFVEWPYILLFYVFFPMTMMIVMVLDSFAGERERHTLETLLASRLPDSAILCGKILSAVAYGWGFTVIFLLVALAVNNAAFWSGHIVTFPLPVLLPMLVAAGLADLLVATVGVLISLTSATVKSGTDLLFVAVIVASAGPFLTYSALPGEWQQGIADTLSGIGMAGAATLAIVVLLALDIVALGTAMWLFRRSRLIEDM